MTRPAARGAADPVAPWVERVRRELRAGGSARQAEVTQRFFQEPIESWGWKTAPLRRYARRLRKEILTEGSEPLLWDVAERLFPAANTEESHTGVFLLEPAAKRMGLEDFRRLERWLPRIHNWASCDALGIGILVHIVVAYPATLPRLFAWGRKRDRWHRRAACVALVYAARQRRYTREILRLSDSLLSDSDDMVQKGVGWLLRELGKSSPQVAIPYLERRRARMSRLVLRTACETLPAAARRKLMAR